MKILVIDDSPFARQVIKDHIGEGQSHEISEAGNGKEGLEKFKEVCPDVTFLDIHMPVMGGVECLKNILEVDSKAKVVLLSGDVRPELKTEVKELTVFRRITKPSNEKEIAKILMDVQSCRRIDHRKSIEKDCTLGNRSDSIEAQTVDMSIRGLGIKTDRTLPFKIGDELDVCVSDQRNYSGKAKVMWIRKVFNNVTRLGLKLYTSIID